LEEAVCWAADRLDSDPGVEVRLVAGKWLVLLALTVEATGAVLTGLAPVMGEAPSILGLEFEAVRLLEEEGRLSLQPRLTWVTTGAG
jgi:hypothetical protein